ncbi:MAG: hypothetical protein ACLQPD_02235 [Desulfomonilaceae bacterium]
MDATGYAIKLYGHGSSDPKQFCCDLARILGIPVDGAEELLNQVPVVLKRGMRKKDAQELHTLLQSIAAWCIVEAPEGEFFTDEMTEKPIQRVIAEDLLGEHVSNQGHPRLWLGIMLGLIVFLALFVLVGFLSYMGSIRDSVGLNKPVTIQSDQPEVPDSDTEEVESPDIIRARIEQLQSSLRSLYARRTEIQKSTDLANAVYLERELGNQIRAEYRDLLALQAKLELMELE